MIGYAELIDLTDCEAKIIGYLMTSNIPLINPLPVTPKKGNTVASGENVLKTYRHIYLKIQTKIYSAAPGISCFIEIVNNNGEPSLPSAHVKSS